MSRWTAPAARRWWHQRAWTCGFNYLPSSAVNFLDMWQADSFDQRAIARELGWAAELGFNAVRVNLHSLVWQHDRDGLLARFDRFLDIASGLGLACVPCLFDDCGFGGAEPRLGPQPAPVPGVHNSRAVASPGRAAVMDRASWPMLERYLRDLVARHARDDRVLFWDLYNEPGNRMIFGAQGVSCFDGPLEAASQALMRLCFDWARAEAPAQPLTVGAWTTPRAGSDDAPFDTDIDRDALALSDIVTFHAYCDAGSAARFIDHLSGLGRPMLCTEWMARPVGSRIADQLPLFHDRGVGCFQWGLVQGRTQTHLPWPAALVAQHGGQADRSVWFHDILAQDGTPYDPAETALIRQLARGGGGAGTHANKGG